jgi:DNA-binding winged helix-turn-helix (wHTH) protein
MVMHVCPECGGTGMWKSKPESIALYNGVHLSGKEGLILAVLGQRFGKCQSKAYLYDALYGDGQSQPEIKIIDVFVCKLRAKMQGGPLVIATHWGRGYSLQFASGALPSPDHPVLLSLPAPAALAAQQAGQEARL